MDERVNPLRFGLDENGQFQMSGGVTINVSARADTTMIIQLPQVL